MISSLLTLIMNIFDLIGVVIICVGAVNALGRYFGGALQQTNPITVDQMRLELGRNIVLAVEFLLAADIIKTIVTPDYYEIGMLGALVIIRTILIYFLNQELTQIETN